MTSGKVIHLLQWKRAFDLMIGTAGFVLLSPLLVLVAVSVRIAVGKPIIFRQLRPGLGGKPFTIYKFRTMLNAGPDGLSDIQRMTKFGSFLRRASLDELPELWNVLRGEMSLVGPRPLLMQYRDRYSTHQQRRHEVLPGITGWAQVNGRNAISWEERFALDLWYVDHQSFWLDMKIFGLTLLRLLMRDGISQPGFATMPEFMGSGKTDEPESSCQAVSCPSLLDS